ncbi:transcription initiation factor TFIID subunit 13-like [Balaenoptera ricei]|uniref:transcription initiation factor TFIID subunit 13-like n=1 Tax=Balaenoptera ricei TaxID=2746895 RepID=UPI0028BE410A|nr:transcription initiation factor TFIID subunit 13-like [Balaenoptera ricei]
MDENFSEFEKNKDLQIKNTLLVLNRSNKIGLAAGIADEEEDPTFEEENEEIGGGAEGGQGKRKRLFSKELWCMMYGFGDDQNPYTESVDILEDLVIEFITEMTHKAMSIGRQGRVQVEDIVFLIRKDPKKFARVKDLLTMNEELKRARKAFDEANYGS